MQQDVDVTITDLSGKKPIQLGIADNVGKQKNDTTVISRFVNTSYFVCIWDTSCDDRHMLAPHMALIMWLHKTLFH